MLEPTLSNEALNTTDTFTEQSNISRADVCSVTDLKSAYWNLLLQRAKPPGATNWLWLVMATGHATSGKSVPTGCVRAGGGLEVGSVSLFAFLHGSAFGRWSCKQHSNAINGWLRICIRSWSGDLFLLAVILETFKDQSLGVRARKSAATDFLRHEAVTAWNFGLN